MKKIALLLSLFSPLVFTLKGSERPTEPQEVIAEQQKEKRALFQCSYCSHLFFKQTNLRFHISIAHAHIQFRCSDCPKKFIRQLSYRQHLTRKHGKKLTAVFYTCTTCQFGTQSFHDITKHLTASHTLEELKESCKNYGSAISTAISYSSDAESSKIAAQKNDRSFRIQPEPMPLSSTEQQRFPHFFATYAVQAATSHFQTMGVQQPQPSFFNNYPAPYALQPGSMDPHFLPQGLPYFPPQCPSSYEEPVYFLQERPETPCPPPSWLKQ